MFNVLVVDDEEIARKNVDILLSQRSDVSDIQHASNGEQAISALTQKLFDIVLLDIQMPLKNGLEVAQCIPSETALVFITAFDLHAVEAFELHAVDYLLKPFDNERFHTAIDRAAERCNSHKQVPNEVFEDLMNKLIIEKMSGQTSKLALREVGKIKLIDPNNIKFIKGAGNYVEIVLMDNKTLLHRETLRDIEARLCSQKFSRIHKSTIVRNDLIVELRPTPKGDYAVKLCSGEELMLSRRNKNKLKLIFKN